MRIGLGFDVHRFEKGETLILGGVNIPCTFGLKGHSDADVLLHALMDAILGALGRGDIGRHFPDSDDRYKDIASTEMLKEVLDLMKKDNYRLNNIDLIIIAQIPKIAPFREKIIHNLSLKLNIAEDRINLKATTTEGLGFIGRQEGMASKAIVSLKKLIREKGEKKNACKGYYD